MTKQGRHEPWQEFQRRNLDAALKLAQATMEKSLAMMRIQNELSQALLSVNLDYAQELAQASSPEEAMRIRGKQAQAVSEQVLSAAQKIAELSNAARNDFARLLAEQLAAGSQEMADAMQGFWQNLPGQGQNVFEAMQQAVTMANRNFEQMTQAAMAAFSAATNPQKHS